MELQVSFPIYSLTFLTCGELFRPLTWPFLITKSILFPTTQTTASLLMCFSIIGIQYYKLQEKRDIEQTLVKKPLLEWNERLITQKGVKTI